jgi:hypothetical protein
MDKATQRKDWPQIGPAVAPFPTRDAGWVVGAPLTTAAAQAVADSPVPPPPGLFATPSSGERP